MAIPDAMTKRGGDKARGRQGEKNSDDARFRYISRQGVKLASFSHLCGYFGYAHFVAFLQHKFTGDFIPL